MRFPCISLHLQEMLVAIAKKQDQTYLTAEHLEAGLKLVVDSLDQTCIDVPFAPKLVRPFAEASVSCLDNPCAVRSYPLHSGIGGVGKQHTAR